MAKNISFRPRQRNADLIDKLKKMAVDANIPTLNEYIEIVLVMHVKNAIRPAQNKEKG